MTATIRFGHAGALVTGPTPAAGINAPVTVGAVVPIPVYATISAPVSVAAPGLGPVIRFAFASSLRTDSSPSVLIQAPVNVIGAVSGPAAGPVIRFAFAGSLAAVQDTTYWSGSAWVDGTTSAFIQAPVMVSAPNFTAPPAAAITFPVKVAGAFGIKRDITVTVALVVDAYTAALEASPYTVTLEDTVPRLIRTSIGDAAYVSGLATEITGKDISASTFQISLGTPNAPGTWLTPTLIEQVTPSQMRVKLLVGSGGTVIASGSYRVWIRIVDSPETESVVADDRVTIL